MKNALLVDFVVTPIALRQLLDDNNNNNINNDDDDNNNNDVRHGF
jgi:hypothetical protein